MEINVKTIRTNDICEKCGGFLAFKVRDEYIDDNNNKTSIGVWECTVCDGVTIGLLMRNVMKKVRL